MPDEISPPREWIEVAVHDGRIPFAMPQRLEEGAVHVWIAHLGSRPGLVNRFCGILDPQERRRADRFQFEILRDRYVLAHGFLRQLLGWYLDADAGKIVFDCNAYGKPGVAGIQFNLSHSGGMAAVVISTEAPAGIDIEEIRPLPDLLDLVSRFFAASERDAVYTSPLNQRETTFFTHWTRKEALVKALGHGLSIPPESFDTTLDSGQGLLSCQATDARWWLSDLPGMAGYAGAVAVKGCTPKLSCWRCVLD
ncbi:MAG: 4'-phosphopantetheinyl transferase superfamily protein [Bryobacterales bacterium]|nr:4'-phosphopantetheinyl transferase superfamily protein [Bryobacterales bacterium]